MWEYPQINITAWYIQVTALMLFTIFYMFFMPSTVVWTLLTLFLLYWTDKVKTSNYPPFVNIDLV